MSISNIYNIGEAPSLCNKTLDSEMNLVSRGSCPIAHFFKWVIYIITCGRVSGNKMLDQQIEKLVIIAQEHLTKQPAEKSRVIAGLKKLMILSKNNFGSKHALIAALIKKHPLDASNPPKLTLSDPSERAVAEFQEMVAGSSALAGCTDAMIKEMHWLCTPKQVKEVAFVSVVDERPKPNGWSTGLGADEEEQSLVDFTAIYGKGCGNVRLRDSCNALNIFMLNSLTEKLTPHQLGILEIVRDYLQTFFKIPATIQQVALQLNENLRRGNQYHADSQFTLLEQNRKENSFSIGFTNQDLYNSGFNMVFGIGHPFSCEGVFSIYQFMQSASDELLIRRLLHIASHEFGHMHGIQHCKNFACCMQGINDISEQDAQPLTFCALDMAKLASLTGDTLASRYQIQLDFFTGFRSKYGNNVNFDREIAHLQKKLARLATSVI